ncbi:flavin-containing monooxygenase [Streptomyces sp. NPDC019531]|uniref:flavin-containing monooxygenase n=1 Tax=Streptomyces sp. NPDC019531 TaxID=3365062 RepID=UPI00384EE061
MKVCVIGSGVFGIAAVRALEAALPDGSLHWFSEDTEAGGLWSTSSSRSRVYDALYLNTSREPSSFTGTSLDAAPGVHFVHHSRYAAYLHEIASRCTVTERRWGCRVGAVSVRPEGGWLVSFTASDGSAREAVFDAVVDATGHSGEPRRPDVPTAARTDYALLHSADHRDAAAHRGQRVLVVGNGASAVDIACDLVGTASEVGISIRTPKWYLPKMLLGRPVDHAPDGWWRHTPVLGRLASGAVESAVRRILGSYRVYGLDDPTSPLAASTPVLSDHFLAHLAHGRLTRYRGVAELGETAVRFNDGSTDKFDTVITATGYRDSSPHLPPAVREVLDRGLLGLALDVPGFPSLYLMNRFRCGDAAVRCAEIQARAVARALRAPRPRPVPRTAVPDAVPSRITARTLEKVYEAYR